MKILIVEDEPALREILEDLFRDQHEVRAVGTGAGGLLVLYSWAPDVLVSDLGLPGVQGEDLARAAAAVPRPPWIVLMSAEPARLDDAGPLADAVLHKPFHRDHLTGLIEAFHRRNH